MSGVVKAAKKVVKGVVNAVKSVVKAVANVVKAVVNFVAQPFMGLLGNVGGIPSASQEAQRQEGVLVTSIGGGTNFIPVVYGIRQVGGTVIYVETGNTKNKYLWVAYALSEGPIEGMYDLSIDDEDVTTAEFISQLNAGQQVTVNKQGRYLGRAVFQFFPGQYINNARSSQIGTIRHLMTQTPSWKETSIFNGLAVLMARYEWREATTQEEADNNPFSGNIPMIKATILGRRVARLSGTPENFEYGQGGYSESYSYNPAECLLDYLRNPRYGKGLKNRDIDWDSFRKAANKFNQTVTYIDGVRGPILTCNTVVDTGNTLMSNVKILLQGMRSYLPYVQGRYKLRVEDAGNETDILSGQATVVASFTKEDIVGEITYTSVERSNKYSEVEVTYVSPPDKWAAQSVVFPDSESERQRLAAEDGGRVNRGTFTFPTLINYAMAYDMARLLLNKSRFQQTCTFKTTLRAMELEPGDVIRITGNILEFGEDIPWRIISLQLNSDQTYTVSCVRNPDFIYPHARAGEKDLVLPTYIPRGSVIYFPGIYFNVGLFPPDGSYWQPGQRPGDGLIGIPNPEPSEPGDPPFEGLPIPYPTVRVIVDRLDYTFNGDVFDVKFVYKQPDDSQFSHVEVWYKRDLAVEREFRQEIFSNRPGPGRDAVGTLKNLLKGPWNYIVLMKVHLRTEQSIAITRVYVDASGSVTQQRPVDYVEYYQLGWRPPTAQQPGFAPEQTAVVGSVIGNPVFSGGTPATPRRLNFTVRQDLALSAVDSRLAFLIIYHRPVGGVYWFKTVLYDADFGLFPGSPVSFQPTLPLGNRTWPAADDDTDNYDFVFRLGYALDGRPESTRQVRYMNVDIERPEPTTPPTNVFADVTPINEVVTAFPIVTVDQAPPGTVADPRQLTLTINNIFRAPDITRPDVANPNIIITEPSISFTFDALTATNLPFFGGIKIRWRPAGSSLPIDNFYEWTREEVIANNWTLNLYRNDQQSLTPPPVNQRVEYVVELIPVGSVGINDQAQSRAIYLAGEVHTRTEEAGFPVNNRWLPTFTVAPSTLEQALTRLGTINPRPPNDTTPSFNPSRITARTILENGLPKPEIQIEISLRYNFNPGGDPDRIAGVKIYYRESFSNNPYWDETEVIFPQPMQANVSTTFLFPEFLARRLFPDVPGQTTVQQNRFDFVIRFLFTDGTEGISQARFMGAPIEWDSLNATYDFNPFAAGIPRQWITSESVNNFELLTKKSAPPGTFLDTLAILPNLDSFFLDEAVTTLSWWVNVGGLTPEQQQFFLGMTVRYREIPLQGTAGDYIVDESNIPLSQNLGEGRFATNDIIYNPSGRYQFVLTPKVRSRDVNTGIFEEVDARKSYFMQGSIALVDRENWRDRLNLTVIDTADIGLKVAPSIDAVSVLGYRRVRVNNSIYHDQSWIELHIDPNSVPRLNRQIAGAQNIRIYRRANRFPVSDGVTPRPDGSVQAKYFGLGRWEYIDLDTSSTGNTQRLADGTLIINLRNPVSHTEFNTLAGSALLNTSSPWSVGAFRLNDEVGLDLDIYITVFQNSVETPYGVLLSGLPGTVGLPNTTTALPRIADRFEFNEYDSGSQRNIDPGSDGARPAILQGTATFVSRTRDGTNRIVQFPNPVSLTNRGRAII